VTERSTLNRVLRDSPAPPEPARPPRAIARRPTPHPVVTFATSSAAAADPRRRAARAILPLLLHARPQSQSPETTLHCGRCYVLAAAAYAAGLLLLHLLLQPFVRYPSHSSQLLAPVLPHEHRPANMRLQAAHAAQLIFWTRLRSLGPVVGNRHLVEDVQLARSRAKAYQVGRLCRGAWARFTIERFRHLSLSAFKKHSASTNRLSAQF
jgi:hypothetical protein